MPSVQDPDIWKLLFEQTPAALRYVLGVLTLGVFTVASLLYKWHRDDMNRVESRIDQLESRLDQHLRDQNILLSQIASNTSRDIR